MSPFGFSPDMPRYTPAAGETVADAIQRDYLKFLASAASHCGNIGTYLRNGQPVVLVNSPELARGLLIDQVGDVTKGDLQHTQIGRASCRERV